MKSKNFFLSTVMVFALCFFTISNGQVRIGGDYAPAKGAILDLGDASSNYVGGLKLPSISITDTGSLPSVFTDIAGIVTAADKLQLKGLIVYNNNPDITGTNANGEGLYHWDGIQWLQVKSNGLSDLDWKLGGNTNGLLRNLGTLDNFDFSFITNGSQRMTITKDGKVGIGTTTPAYPLAVSGGPIAQADYADGDKFLLLGKGTASKITNTSWAFSSYSGDLDAPNTGSYSWNTVNDSNAWKQIMNLNNNGDLTIQGNATIKDLPLSINPSDSLLVVDQTGTIKKVDALPNIGWSLAGNENIESKKLGSTDNTNLHIYTNNSEKMRVGTDGVITINPAAAVTNNAKLAVYGGPVSLANFNNGDKLLLLGANNAAKISYEGDWEYTSYSGSLTQLNKGQFVWKIVQGTAAWTEVMRINNLGQVHVGPGSGTFSSLFSVNGTAGGTSAWAVTSDRRYKTHIETIQNPISIVERLRGTTYDFKTQEFPTMNFNTGKQYGVIAQEVEEVLPELVSTNKDGYKSVNYDGMIPVLIEAIKAQQETIQAQQKRIEALEEKFNSQK